MLEFAGKSDKPTPQEQSLEDTGTEQVTLLALRLTRQKAESLPTKLVAVVYFLLWIVNGICLFHKILTMQERLYLLEITNSTALGLLCLRAYIIYLLNKSNKGEA